MNAQNVQELARRLAESVPGTVQAAREDLERNFEALIASAFARMDLVTREEFEIQQKVLQRTREKLSRLETELAALETRLGASGDVGS